VRLAFWNRQGNSAPQKIGQMRKRKILSNALFKLIGPVDKIGIVSITRNLVNGIATDLALVQVIQYFQFFVNTQLLVKQLNQLFKTACTHSASQSFISQATCRKACIGISE
jgi:hypothetical protein